MNVCITGTKTKTIVNSSWGSFLEVFSGTKEVQYILQVLLDSSLNLLYPIGGPTYYYFLSYWLLTKQEEALHQRVTFRVT